MDTPIPGLDAVRSATVRELHLGWKWFLSICYPILHHEQDSITTGHQMHLSLWVTVCPSCGLVLACVLSLRLLEGVGDARSVAWDTHCDELILCHSCLFCKDSCSSSVVLASPLTLDLLDQNTSRSVFSRWPSSLSKSSTKVLFVSLDFFWVMGSKEAGQ